MTGSTNFALRAGRLMPAVFVAVAMLLTVVVPAAAVDNRAWVALPGVLLGGVVFFLLPARVVSGVALAAASAAVFAGASPTAPDAVQRIAVLGACAVLAAALLRSPAWSARSLGVSAVLVAWFALLVIVTLVSDDGQLVPAALSVAAPVLTALVVARCTAADLVVFARAFLLIAGAEVLLGGVEVLGLSQPVWGYPTNGSGVPIVRYNPLVDSLPRTQGTLGHPLIFGFVTAFAFVVAWLDVARLGTAMRLAASGLLGIGILLSGTRSAAVAAVIAIVLWTAIGRSGTVRLVLAGVIAALGGLAVWTSIQDSVDELGSSGSYTHRLGALEAVPELVAGRSGLELLFGTGYGSVRDLFERGLLQGDDFFAIDNQFVTALAVTGVVGFLLTVAVLIAGAFIGTARSRALLLYVVIMFFSFDVTEWVASSILFAFAVVWGSRLLASAHTADPHPPESRSVDEQAVRQAT